jgi:hypothetical protein
VRPSTDAHALRWMPPPALQCHSTSGDGRQLIRSAGADPWAAAGALPSSGRSGCVMQVDHVAHSSGLLCVGVCDADATHAWGLHLQSGRLLRQRRDASGRVLVGDGAPPPGFPDGHGTRVLVAPPAALRGATIEVLLDADAGTLSFRLGSGDAALALRGLPRAPLRPWARLVSVSDRLSLAGPREQAGSRRAVGAADFACLGRGGLPGRHIV